MDVTPKKETGPRRTQEGRGGEKGKVFFEHLQDREGMEPRTGRKEKLRDSISLQNRRNMSLFRARVSLQKMLTCSRKEDRKQRLSSA